MGRAGQRGCLSVACYCWGSGSTLLLLLLESHRLLYLLLLLLVCVSRKRLAVSIWGWVLGRDWACCNLG